jgi:hypothetical protein
MQGVFHRQGFQQVEGPLAINRWFRRLIASGVRRTCRTRKGEERATDPGMGYFMVTVIGTGNAMALLSFLKISVLS